MRPFLLENADTVSGQSFDHADDRLEVSDQLPGTALSSLIDMLEFTAVPVLNGVDHFRSI